MSELQSCVRFCRADRIGACGSPLERAFERIFCRSWGLAGRAEQPVEAGDHFTFELGSESVLVVPGRDGVLRGFYSVCRHRGARLCAARAGCFEGACTSTLDGTTRRPIFAGLRDRPRQQYHAELVLPNLLLYLFPDSV